MLKTAANHYFNNFRGFTREIWILTLITFINRAGTMVLPFLAKYLNEDLQFSLDQVSWIMVSFGLGSMLGSWLGGKLSDKIGFYKIMVFSLFTSGVSLFFVQYITSFWGLCIAMFVLMTIADMFRPAMFVSLGAYAKPENRTRALTLVRLAVNLGFAAGPALGGLIIMGMGYSGLFWVDGASCIISISIFALLVKEKKKVDHDDKIESVLNVKSVFHDKIFWAFLFVSFVTAIIFFQLFTTLPLYHHKQYGLNEFQTGLLMTLNGLLIFALEMPTVGFMERKGFPKIKIIIIGSFVMALSFFLLLINVWAGILVISMICISIGEILTFPFSNAFALSRAPRGQEGRYMALYTMSFSLAHIFSTKLGFGIADHFGYQKNWLFMASIGIMATLCCLWIRKALLLEKNK
ncbi:Predicted arabinose efflux permease, MFS family [Flavobacterium sp. CF108]|uniref:MDR family MFS transporter n=1 Tax=unclassified Flavobacterium TaxID=196869 RepID=UPI0008AF79BB|nr:MULTISPECIES: MFS transporter [unclassified Flavobacterium]SEO29055.1 Predicted arabinose efflux permease, MFS family [Flavobacterium sp. fv08]SHG43784.1 Predicted arabinose efflux permease, MFS family [Flavobacterium sp. CF108]